MKIKKPESLLLAFLVLSLIWIIVSEVMLMHGTISAQAALEADLYRDVLFVIAISAALYFGSKFYRQQITQSRREFFDLFESNPTPMWLFDPVTLQFVAVNKSAEKHYGYTAEEFSRMTIRDIRPASEIPKFELTYKKEVNDIENSGVWKHIKKNGEISDVLVKAHDITYKRKHCRLIVANDITELLQVRAQNELLSEVAQKTNNTIIITDDTGRIQWVNAAFTRNTGFTLEEVKHRTPLHFLRNNGNGKNIAVQILNKIKEHKKFSGEVRGYCKDGSMPWLHVNISPIEQNGIVRHFVAIESDITGLKLKEEKISKQNKMFRELAFTGSHVIRAPLSNVLGLVDLILQCKNDKALMDESLQLLKIAATKLDEVVTSMVISSVESVE